MFHLALFDPQGIIAFQERNIMIMVVLLMLIAVVPAYVLLIIFTRKYRARNLENHFQDSKITFQDNSSTKLVWLFWFLPAFVIFMICSVTWYTTHALDPYRSISSSNPPLTIQVVALPWKWLFIYPDQHIATVNILEFPVNTPVHFELTADNAPMTAFWIPELGSQMFAMTSMSSQLNLLATKTGDFRGVNTEINGAGFSGMTFTAHSVSLNDFDAWVNTTQQNSNILDQQVYQNLVKPSENNPPAFYSSVDSSLYSKVIEKYMMPVSSEHID